MASLGHFEVAVQVPAQWRRQGMGHTAGGLIRDGAVQRMMERQAWGSQADKVQGLVGERRIGLEKRVAGRASVQGKRTNGSMGGS